MRTDVCI